MVRAAVDSTSPTVLGGGVPKLNRPTMEGGALCPHLLLAGWQFGIIVHAQGVVPGELATAHSLSTDTNFMSTNFSCSITFCLI